MHKAADTSKVSNNVLNKPKVPVMVAIIPDNIVAVGGANVTESTSAIAAANEKICNKKSNLSSAAAEMSTRRRRTGLQDGVSKK
jgi:hypothetical protein